MLVNEITENTLEEIMLEEIRGGMEEILIAILDGEIGRGRDLESAVSDLMYFNSDNEYEGKWYNFPEDDWEEIDFDYIYKTIVSENNANCPKIIIEFTMGNAGMQNDYDIARLFKNMAQEVNRNGFKSLDGQSIMDVNGNKIGKITFK